MIPIPKAPAAVTLPKPPGAPPAPERVGPLPPLAFPALDNGQISSLQFYPDGRRLTLGYGNDAEVTVWNLETGQLDWQRHVDGANGGPVIMDPKQRFLIVESGDMDSGLQFLACTPKGHLLRKFPAYASERLANWDSSAFVWLKKSGRILVMAGDIGRFLPNGSYVPHRCRDTYETRTWRRIGHVVVGSKIPPPLASSGQVIYGELPVEPSQYVSSKGLPLGNWWKRDANPPFDNTYTASWKNYYARATGNSISRGCVEVWDMRKGKKLWLAPLKHQAARAAAISPDGRVLAVGTVQGQVFFWQLQTGRLIARKSYSDFISDLAFSPNSRVLAASCGSYRGRGVRLIDGVSHKLLAVLSVAFPDNNNAEKDWTLDHPDWFAALPDLSYLASEGVIRKMRTPGHPRTAAALRRFEHPARIRAALRRCYAELQGRRSE